MMSKSNKKIIIVDYGLGNLFSVDQACKTVGLNAQISNIKDEILSADALILPGVGAFIEAMNNLEKLDIRYNTGLNKLGKYPNLTSLLISNTSIDNLHLYMDLKILECNATYINILPPFPKLEILECDATLSKNLPYLPKLIKEEIQNKN